MVMDTKSVSFEKSQITIREAVSLFPSEDRSDRQGGQSMAFSCDLSQVSLSAWNKTEQHTGTMESPSESQDSHQGNGYFYILLHAALTQTDTACCKNLHAWLIYKM